ncbi:unnamed protein product [Toxocara canis]|uniref:MFS transporter n=1 Tax=Toxocara canis TaxID=6265 RepID=A0A183U962_TOXCA|nr:unnamed protein product [Toxocara canis]
MGSYGPAKMLGVYGGVVGLIYIETDGFRQDAPFLYAIPMIALAALTFTLTMENAIKFLTAFSFFAAGK